MFVWNIEIGVEDVNPGQLPRLGETLVLSLPRMDEPQEFIVSEINVKRVYVGEDSGDDDNHVYRGTVKLEAVFEDDDDEDGEPTHAIAPMDRAEASR